MTLSKQPEKPETAKRRRPPVFRALGSQDPPLDVEIGGKRCRRIDIFKHDSWAATALYRAETDGSKLVCKFNRQEPILGIPMQWLGKWLARREGRLLQRLGDQPNIPRHSGEVRVDGKFIPTAVAHDFIAGHPLEQGERVNDAFFPTLAKLLRVIHSRDVAYVDLHKRENIVVGDDGEPYLVDFQVCFILPESWPGRGLLRGFLRMMQRTDDYHLDKHRAWNRPDQAGFDILSMRVRRPWWVRAHRMFARPLRSLRRALLVKLGIRNGRGTVETESFPEDAIRRTLQRERKAA